MRIAPLALAALLLGGCHSTDPQDPSAQAAAPSSMQAAPDGDPSSTNAPPDSVEAGHYTIGSTKVRFGHALRLPDADGKLRFILTPDALDTNEQATVRGESWTGLSLLDKRTALYGDRYPFVVIELRPGDSGTADDVRHLYVMASSIATPNHTDNINRSGFNHGVELLEHDGERVRIRASGQQDISGEIRSWAFDIAG